MKEKNIYDICVEPECSEEPTPTEMPSTYEMLKGFIKSGKDIVGGVMAGEGLMVDENTFNDRMDVCKTCPRYVVESSRCMECGCFMRAKAMFKKTHCPLHKWNSI